MRGRKWMVLLLGILVIMVMLPVGTFAEDECPDRLIVGGTEITSAGYWRNDGRGGLTTRNAGQYNYHVYYDGAGTLILQNANISRVSRVESDVIVDEKYDEEYYLRPVIYAKGGSLTIHLKGSNHLSATAGGPDTSAAIYTDGLIITGSGSLKASGGSSESTSYGIYAGTGGISLTGGKVIACGAASDFASYGIYSRGKITILGADVRASADTGIKSSGVSTNDILEIADGGILTASGGNATESRGVRVTEQLIVTDGKLVASAASAEDSCGISIYPGNLSVLGGVVTAIGAEASNTSFGVTVPMGKIEITGGTLEAISANAGKWSQGVHVMGSLSVSADRNGCGGVLIANDIKVVAFEDRIDASKEQSLVMVGNTGSVTGMVRLNADLTVPDGTTLLIPEQAALVIPEGICVSIQPGGKIENNGQIILQKGGSLFNQNLVIGSGRIIEPSEDGLMDGGNGATFLVVNGKVASGWTAYNGGWYYSDPADDNLVVNRWRKIGGSWYLFGMDGRMLTGWQQRNRIWYYLNDWGGMAAGQWHQDTDGHWYYLDENGAMAKSVWIEWHGKEYYLGKDGAMLSDTVTPDGFLVDADGVRIE